MNTSKIDNKSSDDRLDKLIFEENLRIKELFIDKEIDLLIIIFNNGKLLKLHLSDYPKLNKATQKELSNWRLISGGTGIHWEEINEDLSLKGFIKSAVLNKIIRNLSEKGNDEVIFA